MSWLQCRRLTTKGLTGTTVTFALTFDAGSRSKGERYIEAMFTINLKYTRVCVWVGAMVREYT